MISFQKAVFPLLLMAFLIIIGNTGFPCIPVLPIMIKNAISSKGKTAFWKEIIESGVRVKPSKTLTVVLVSYYIGFHIIGMVSMVGWIMTQDRWGNVG
jgi:Trk-type K+ transport system membrane component